jgi:menaquinone-dependent protoporphyrinogen oxidase
MEASMLFFIAYATIEGHTRKIAQAVADTIEKAGHRVRLMNVGELIEYTLEPADGVILCAPIHGGHYPQPFLDFVERESVWLSGLPSAFVSVSLSITSDNADERTEVRNIAEALADATGWAPQAVHHAAGALRYTEYDFFKRWMARRLAGSRGAPVDTGRNFELTDWPALAAFAETFVASARPDR